MTSLSFRDIENLSAYLDGQLFRVPERRAWRSACRSDPVLASGAGRTAPDA